MFTKGEQTNSGIPVLCETVYFAIFSKEQKGESKTTALTISLIWGFAPYLLRKCRIVDAPIDLPQRNISGTPFSLNLLIRQSELVSFYIDLRLLRFRS